LVAGKRGTLAPFACCSPYAAHRLAVGQTTADEQQVERTIPAADGLPTAVPAPPHC